MKTTSLALVAVILSTLSGASLAAQSAGYAQAPSATVASSVTGSTTLVSLDGQLSGKPVARTVAWRISAPAVTREASGIAISDH